jgi:excisionase family DNA binding protein
MPADTDTDTDTGTEPAHAAPGGSSMLARPLLTVHEVALMLKLRESTIRSLIVSTKLRAIKFGREWRITERDLETFLNDNANREA